VNSGRAVRETFSRDDRLRKRTEFEACYSSGVRVSQRHLVLYLLPKPGALRPRLGVSVSKKVGDAVTRNRVKRRLKEIFRKSPARLSAHGSEIVINARPSAAAAPYAELERDFRSGIERALARGKQAP
jgi:ribonuclease P protein component